MPRQRSGVVLFMLLAFCSAGPATSALAAEQSGTADKTAAADDISRIQDLEKTLGAEDSHPTMRPEPVPEQYLDEAGKEALQQSLQSYYEYRTQGFEHRQRVFEWQLLSSRVIFFVVIFLVITGVYFSWLQFKVDLQREKDGGQKSSPSTVKASSGGLEVSSPVLGVIILVISLLFFYLYLAHVYPIEEIL